MRPQPLIAVADVEASSRWYQRLLGCQSAHGGKEYERLTRDGVLVLQLHHWDVEHHHGPIGDRRSKPYGNGVLLWFETEDFDAAVARAEELKAEVLKPPFRNPPSDKAWAPGATKIPPQASGGGPDHWELWLRDPDGYTVVLASPDNSAE
jgi:catechol 2,3-dioxygenase-like lactoylglutathione lyase family enzyme